MEESKALAVSSVFISSLSWIDQTYSITILQCLKVVKTAALNKAKEGHFYVEISCFCIIWQYIAEL